MAEHFNVGSIEIKFLLTKEDTSGSMDLFEFLVPPGAKVPMPHYHRDFDEATYGLSGVLTWIVEGKETPLHPGDHMFIPRGAVHHFVNRGDVPARVLAVLTPGRVGTGFFKDAGAAIAAAQGGAPDPAVMREVFARYGVVAVPEALG